MKKIALALLCLLSLQGAANAQRFIKSQRPSKVYVEQPQKSNFQTFVSLQGGYQISEFKISEIQSETSDKFAVSLITATNSKGEKVSAIKFLPSSADLIAREDLFLDSDEIPALLKAFAEMVDKSKSYKPAENEVFRYSFLSRAGVDFQLRSKPGYYRFYFGVDEIAMNDQNFERLTEAIKKVQSLL